MKRSHTVFCWASVYIWIMDAPFLNASSFLPQSLSPVKAWRDELTGECFSAVIRYRGTVAQRFYLWPSCQTVVKGQSCDRQAVVQEAPSVTTHTYLCCALKEYKGNLKCSENTAMRFFTEESNQHVETSPARCEIVVQHRSSSCRERTSTVCVYLFIYYYLLIYILFLCINIYLYIKINFIYI